MSSKQAFIDIFADLEAPQELLRLWDFEEGCGRAYFANGVELTVDGKIGLSTWSEAPAFLERFFPFAQADGTGSIYALWLPAMDAILREAPVVVFGSEGGVHIVAATVRELLQLLSFDAEPMVDHEGVSYYKDEEEQEPSEHHKAYAACLADHWDLEVIDDADALVEAAQAQWGDTFQRWAEGFIDIG